MSAIYDNAVRSFEAAAQLLMSLQARRSALLASAAQGLEGRPKLVLTPGYTALSTSLAVCIPDSTRVEIVPTEDDLALEVHNSGIDWMTFEAIVPERDACQCYIDADVAFPVETIADVFLRDVTRTGKARDSGHQQWRLAVDPAAVCMLALPAAPGDVASRQIVIYLRQPPLRFTLRGLAMTLV